MATLADIAAAGHLLRHEPYLEAWEQVERCIYVTPEFDQWLCDVLSRQPIDRGRRQQKPLEQVEQLFYEFVIGRRLAYGTDHKKLEPVGLSVWELRTEDVRVFGYVYRKGIFIAVAGEMKKNLRSAKKYAPFVQRVAAFMRDVGLDEPMCLAGTKLDEVF